MNHSHAKVKYVLLVFLLLLCCVAHGEILLILGSGETLECKSLDFNELRGRIALVTDKNIEITLDARKCKGAGSPENTQSGNADLAQYEEKIRNLKEENDNIRKEIDELKSDCYDLKKTCDDLNILLAAQYQDHYIRSLPPIPSKKIIETPRPPKSVNKSLPDLQYILQLIDMSQQRNSYRVLRNRNRSHYHINRSSYQSPSAKTRTNCSSFG